MMIIKLLLNNLWEE